MSIASRRPPGTPRLGECAPRHVRPALDRSPDKRSYEDVEREAHPADMARHLRRNRSSSRPCSRSTRRIRRRSMRGFVENEATRMRVVTPTRCSGPYARQRPCHRPRHDTSSHRLRQLLDSVTRHRWHQRHREGRFAFGARRSRTTPRAGCRGPDPLLLFATSLQGKAPANHLPEPAAPHRLVLTALFERLRRARTRRTDATVTHSTTGSVRRHASAHPTEHVSDTRNTPTAGSESQVRGVRGGLRRQPEVEVMGLEPTTSTLRT